MYIVYLLMFFLGATLSSFFFLIGERVPQHKHITGRSFCNHCKHKLRFVDELPIIGYIINLGKCHYCKNPISIYYLLYELLGGLIFVFSYIVLGFSLELIIALTLISVFLIETISDALYQIVLDKVWIIGAVIVIIIRLFQKNFSIYIFSALFLFSFMFLIGYLSTKTTKKEALGGGDIKLFFFIGLTMSVWNGLLALFFTSFIALVFAIVFKKSRKDYLPLVPFIFIGTFITYFYGDIIINWYLNIFGM